MCTVVGLGEGLCLFLSFSSLLGGLDLEREHRLLSCLRREGLGEPGELPELELRDVLELPERLDAEDELEPLLEPVLVLEPELEVELNRDLLMYYLKTLKFTTHDGMRIEIDDNGAVTGNYDILNWQLDDNGEIAFVKLPHSVCTDLCQRGTRKGIRHGEPRCCFDCILCVMGMCHGNQVEMSLCPAKCPKSFFNLSQRENFSESCIRPLAPLGYTQLKGTSGFLCSQSSVLCSLGQRECEQCGEDYWSNAQKSECVLKEVEFLAYDEVLGFTLVILSIFGSLVVSAVTVVYVIYRHTPLVTANDRELSFLVQVSLVITLLSSMFFIGKPYNWSCMAHQVTLALGFSLYLSCILGKTISLFLAYKISKSKTRLISIHPLYWKISVLISVVVEIGICTAYLVLEPPRVYKNMESQNIKIILECYEGSIEFLCSIFGMDVFLALLCFLTTLVAHQLPDNYYEGKCITFGMLVFFIVWISFVPAYLSTKGKFKVAVEIFAILASSYGLLGCIFAAKCFNILLRPKRNADEIVGGRVPTVDKNIQLTSASVSSELNNTMVSTVRMSRVMGCMCPSELQWRYGSTFPFRWFPQQLPDVLGLF
ncbi:hypothetical protein J1605_000506 [Eschrichtius robustus]|uniref:G-protein coupled receptors family 3 profile domain-containing protein n=1 Tax=Eschrichtius robustus TaxID=9764 RepID=A0AB34H5R7_ESCRO|nr:hypothetical protein J1605_000506 [Eschrichtius robustus]